VLAARKVASSPVLAAAECETWQQKICTESGAGSAGYAQARSAAELLPTGACSMALGDGPATLDARAAQTQSTRRSLRRTS
jgi:hypothetical protein